MLFGAVRGDLYESCWCVGVRRKSEFWMDRVDERVEEVNWLRQSSFAAAQGFE